MIRAVVFLLASILLITVVRSVIGILMKGFSDLMSTPTTPAGKPRPATDVPPGGELKKDPICGTYVSSATSLKKAVGGETVYFCSQTCFDRFHA